MLSSKFATAIIAISLLFALPIYGQDLPDKIRGYKVHRVNVKVTTSGNDQPVAVDDSKATIVSIGEPRIVDIALSGVTFEADADIGTIPQSGEIEFLTFNDFQVNGVAVEFEEFKHPFDIKKGVAIKLPKPVRGFLSTLNIAKAGYKEFVESKAEWNVTGTVFVFGKFKKFGFKFKRVVPVKIDLKIKNPLA